MSFVLCNVLLERVLHKYQ